MFETHDYLTNEPWTGLVRMISDRTYHILSPSHCTLVDFSAITGLQTQVVIKTHRSKAVGNLLPAIPEELTYIYSRLDPDSYLGTRTVGTLKVPTDTTAILAEITKQTDITFGIDDFEAIEVTDYGSIELVSKPESLRWVGSFTVHLVNQTANTLTEVISQPVLGNVILAPSATDTREVDAVYFGATDFTAHRYTMEAIAWSINGVEPDNIAAVLNQVTGDPWVCSAEPSAFNICVEVKEGKPLPHLVYAGGPVSRFTMRTDKRRVVVLDINETLCTGFKGRVLMHYD